MKTFSLLFLVTVLAAVATETFAFKRLRQNSLKGAILDRGFELERQIDRKKRIPLEKAPKEVCGVDFEAANAVKDLFESSGEDWEKCNKVIKPVDKAADTLADAVSIVHLASQGVEEFSGSIAKFAKEVEVTAKASLTKLTAIPKIGQVIKAIIQVIDKAEDALKKADLNIEKVTKILGKIEKVTGKISKVVGGVAKSTTTAEVTLFGAAKVHAGIIECSRKTSSCSDDEKVETFSKGLVSTAERIKDVSEICPRVIEKVDGALERLLSIFETDVFDRIRNALEKLQKALQPILDKIEDFIAEVGKHFQKAYCCTVPTVGQVFFKGVSQILDLATCPLEPLTAGVDKAIQAFIEVINNAFLSWAERLLNAIPDVEFPVPEITTGEVDFKSCLFELPSAGIKKISIFDELGNALEAEKPSLKPITQAFKDIGKDVRDSCKEAAKDLGKNLLGDCCKFFVPLPDGHRCDPLNKIPFRKCAQCTSGAFSLDFQQVSTVCGKRSLKEEFIELGDDIKDTATKVGDGVKNAADKVGKGVNNAAKKVASGAKKAAKKVRKFFG